MGRQSFRKFCSGNGHKKVFVISQNSLPPSHIAQIQKEMISNLKLENQFLLKEIWNLYDKFLDKNENKNSCFSEHSARGKYFLANNQLAENNFLRTLSYHEKILEF